MFGFVALTSDPGPLGTLRLGAEAAAHGKAARRARSTGRALAERIASGCSENVPVPVCGSGPRSRVSDSYSEEPALDLINPLNPICSHLNTKVVNEKAGTVALKRSLDSAAVLVTGLMRVGSEGGLASLTEPESVVMLTLLRSGPAIVIATT
jgi:hypothetical protein